MDIKRILLIALVATSLVASVSAVSAGWFDGLFGPEAHDNVVEIDGITFNTTNATKFVLNNQTEDEDGNWKWYVDENRTGYNVHIYNYSFADDMTWNSIAQSYSSYMIDNSSSQTVDGITVYPVAADSITNIGENGFVAYVTDNNLHVLVDVSSPDPAETAKMASTLKLE